MTTRTDEARELQKVADQVQRAQDAGALLGAMVGRLTAVSLGPEVRAHAADEARTQAEVVRQSCINALERLEGMGAEMRGPFDSEPHPASVAAGGVPLHLISTPATRELLAGIESLIEKAAAVDVERGWVDKDGEANGWAETLQGMAIRLRMEVEGPKGRD